MSAPLAPPDAVLRELLQARPVIALVGASIRPERPSHGVMAELLRWGYDVVPVHPTYPEVLGRKCYPDLASIPGKVELVDVFRRAEATPDVARAAVAKGARVLWLQLGVVNGEARRIARAAGLVVVMDRCVAVEHRRLIG
jgi:predicted CoA-binding protein